MKEKLLNFVDKTRKKILDYFFFELTDPELPTPKKEKKTKTKNVEKFPMKKYISRNSAIAIADEEQNLRKSLYKEARKAGYDYALIEIIDYCATLVLVEKKYAWYVKVSDGTYNCPRSRSPPEYRKPPRHSGRPPAQKRWDCFRRGFS